MSILTFNMSVKDKSLVASVTDPFQIMPATNNHISDKSLANYVTATDDNRDVLLHMNYITRVFSNEAVMNDSTVRFSLRQYVKLAKVLHTKDILIHLPYTEEEWKNLAKGLTVINDEICSKGFYVHLEIPAWANSLFQAFRFRQGSDPIPHMCNYLEKTFEICSEFDLDKFKLVPDTAHLFANGFTKVEHFDWLFENYCDFVKYVHLNGNMCVPFKMDNHVPIFDTEFNKMKFSIELAKKCAKMNLICIAEITKYGSSWENWEQFANECGFKLAEFVETYTI